MSVYLFSNPLRSGTVIKAALLSTTAFVFSVMTSFAEDAYISECVGCAGNQDLLSILNDLSERANTADEQAVAIEVSGGQIQTTGLAADEFDVRLEEKSLGAQKTSENYDSPETAAIPDTAAADKLAVRQVYVPERAKVSASLPAKQPKLQQPKTPAFKEASLNITPEEELYLRDGSVYVSRKRPVPKVTASPAFDNYAPYTDSVKVAPIAAYKAALNASAKTQEKEKEKFSAPVLTKIEEPVAAAKAKSESASRPTDNFTLSPIPSPAFADSLQPAKTKIQPATISEASSQISPLEALLLSDSSAAPAFTSQNSVASNDIPAFSNSFSEKSKKAEDKSSESEQASLLVPMEGNAYAYSNAYKSQDNEVSYGGAVNTPSSSKDTGGYGTNYDSFTPAYEAPTAPLFTENASGITETQVANKPAAAKNNEKAADKGIIDKLKDWFSAPDTNTAVAENPASKKLQKAAPSTMPASVDEVLSRYTNKNKQRNDTQSVVASDPMAIAVIFGEKSSNISAKTLRRLGDFAENAASLENAFVKIQISKADLSLQAKRFALIKSILMSNGVSLDRIRPSVDGDNPDAVILRVETPTHIVGAYEKIEAMGG